MICNFFERRDDGMYKLATIPLKSGQPMAGDSITIESGEDIAAFVVHERDWRMTENPDGGGVSVSVNLVLLKVGSRKLEAANEESDQDLD